MTLNDNATIVFDAGNYFTATYSPTSPVAMPADLLAPGASFDNIGHTSLDEVLRMASEGGDATQIGSLQNRTLRTKYSDRTDSILVTLEQFDTKSLKLYYGKNATVGANGEVQVPTKGEPTIATFLAVFADGDNVFAIYAPKAEIFRADTIAVPQDGLAGLPLAVKPVKHGDNNWAYAITPLGDV